jgi:hypothetical protein
VHPHFGESDMGKRVSNRSVRNSTNLTMLRFVDGCYGGSSLEETSLPRRSGYMILACDYSRQIRPWPYSSTAIRSVPDIRRDFREILTGAFKTTNPQIAM